MKFLYEAFVCENDRLQARLTELGQEGWRLHTCEPVQLSGPGGELHWGVVMDKAVEQEPEPYVPEPASEGIAMKG
jgi:hypothetical protein